MTQDFETDLPAADSESSAADPDTPTADPYTVTPLEPELFREALAAWYRRHARKLPWRGTRDPYATWLSEIMLQQTRVATVIDRYNGFLVRFPTIASLAAAPEDDVLALWSGLGYYRRARMLHRGAQFVERELGGRLPHTAVALRTLPGVGEYTAAAIASIAFGESVAVLDGNVERVLFRILGQPEERTAAAHNRLLGVAQALIPPVPARRSRINRPGNHNQAMMELGATVCLPRNPLCLHCPVYAFCHTRGEHRTAARGKLRSRHVAYLLATRKVGVVTEVLLERRPAEASLMPGLLELPPLPLEAAAGQEPVLRLRHGITDTNYYVEIYADRPAGSPAGDGRPGTGEAVRPHLQEAFGFSAEPAVAVTADEDEDSTEQVFEAEAATECGTAALWGLRSSIPAAPEDLCWCPARQLTARPLTGLTRKVLQRLGLMPVRPVR